MSGIGISLLIYKIFKNSISGNASVNLSTEMGDIDSYFEGSIDGNSKVNIETKKGNIYLVSGENHG